MQPLCHNFCYGFLTAGMHLSEIINAANTANITDKAINIDKKF